MKTSLTKGLLEDDIKLFKQEFLGSAYMRKQIIKVLEGKIEDNRVGMRLKENYNNPNWANFQADAIGYERAMNELISLLKN